MSEMNVRASAPAPAGTPAPVGAPAALSIDLRSFSYAGADAPVLRDIELELPQGSFALLTGSTGSGKSTLLSLIKPQIAPVGERVGTIRVFGQDVYRMTDEQSARTVGFVFQDPGNQVVCDSVWHEMAFGLEGLGTPQDEMRRRVAEMSYFFGMDSWFRASTDALSGGRKQLLALASTLVMRPGLLLLDEPTAQLDPIAAKNFAHALFRVNRELGCTVVVATHAPELLIDYATCAFDLEDGSLRAVGDLNSLKVPAPFEPRAARSRTARNVACGALGSPAAPAGLRRERPAGPNDADYERVDADLRDVWFRYGRDASWVLRGLDLEVGRGEFRALVGGNGCGKSTLLALMAGTQKPRRGKVAMAQGRRALLPQDPKALFACETVYDELMEWSGAGSYHAREVEEMLDRLGLASRSSLHPYDLSGGQRQLLALGKLMLLRPSLLLLDEPTKGLDRTARRLVADLLEAERARGATIVVATHDLAFVRAAATSVSMVFDGELACTEPVDEFFQNNLFYRP